MSVVARRYFNRGCDFLDEGDFGSAIEQLRSAVDLAPAFTEARLALAAALAGFGDRMTAAEVLQVGLGRVKLAVSRARLAAMLADVLVGVGDIAGAERALEAVASEPSLRGRVTAARARIAARERDHARALRHWTELVEG